MLAALILRQLDECRIPAVGSQTRSGVYRQAEIVSDLGPSQPLSLILVKSR